MRLTIAEIRIEPADIPMASPFESARRRSTVACNARVEVTLSDGTRGLGEASPAAYVTGEDQASVCATAPFVWSYTVATGAPVKRSRLVMAVPRLAPSDANAAGMRGSSR